MRAPRPIFVAAVLLVFALFNLSRADVDATPRGMVYLVGLFLLPVVLSLLYAWWYRRRYRT